MKRKLLIGSIATVFAVSAQASTEMRSFSYKLKQGEFDYTTGFNVAYGEQRVSYIPAGTKSYDDTASFTKTWTNTLNYGFNDKLTLGLRINHALTNKYEYLKSDKANFTKYQINNNGFRDFAFDLNYRVIEGKSTLDTIVGFTYGGNSERGNKEENSGQITEGNGLRGYSSIDLAVIATAPYKNFEFQLKGTGNINLPGKKTYKSSQTKYEENDAFYNLGGELAGQYYFNDNVTFLIVTGLTWTNSFDTDVTTTPSNYVVTQDSDLSYYFGGGMKFAITKDLLFNFTYKRIGANDREDTVDSSGKVKLTDRSYNSLDYVFTYRF